MFELSVNDIEYIKKKICYGYSTVRKITDKIEWDGISAKNAELDSVCYCSLNQGNHFSEANCPYCHKKLDFVIPKEISNINLSTRYFKKTLSFYSKKPTSLYFIKEKDNGILIYKIELSESKIKKLSDEVKEIVKIVNVVDFSIGNKAVAYKQTKNTFVEVDLFETLRINTQTLKSTDNLNFIYKDATGLIDFLVKNKDFAKKTGLLELINLIDIAIPRNMILFTYIYLLSEYPAIELLIKMRHINLISDLFKKMQSGYNKESIRNNVKGFNNLIIDTKEGSKALAMPKFAADVLKEANANLLNYEAWAMAFSYQKFSKEQFMECLTNPIVAQLNSYTLTHAFELIKYGYTLHSLFTYFEKNSICSDRGIEILKDYLEMSQLMGIKPDLYPKNYEAAHDNIMSAYKAKENELADRFFAQLNANCKKLIPEHNDYTIIIPNSVQDFVNEGRNQHNCVASYTQAVLKKQSIIFFIRKKEDVDDTYITAEFSQRDKQLCQIKYKYNKSVYDEEEIKYANKFCEILKKKGEKIYEGTNAL